MIGQNFIELRGRSRNCVAMFWAPSKTIEFSWRTEAPCAAMMVISVISTSVTLMRFEEDWYS